MIKARDEEIKSLQKQLEEKQVALDDAMEILKNM